VVATRKIGLKLDAEKDRWDLLPPRAARLVVKALGFGASIYGDDNWRRVKSLRRRYYAATLRHVIAWWAGEANDPDSGLPHLAHAICCLLFILDDETRSRRA